MTNSNTKAWVDTVTDLNQYKPSQEELEQKKLARKSNNKLLAKVTLMMKVMIKMMLLQVALSDRRVSQLDPEKQRLIEQQILLEQRKHPNQNVEAILARSEQVMEICQGILNGEMITPSYSQLARDQGPPVEPEQEKEVRKEVVQEPEPPAPPAQHVTPYMNSAALNEIAGELLITVRELREELLQVCRRERIISRTKINC